LFRGKAALSATVFVKRTKPRIDKHSKDMTILSKGAENMKR
jgi:hypothetical protein